MATLYKRPDSKFWQARFQYKNQDYRTSTDTTSRTVAERRAEKWEAEIKELAWGGMAPRDFMDAMHEFLTVHGKTLKPQSLRRYMVSAKALIPHFKGKKLHKIARADLAEYEMVRREEGVTAPTIRRDLACLSSMFSFEMEFERVGYNPVPAFLKSRKKRGLREAKPRTRYLSHDEEHRLLEAAPDYLRPMIAFAIDTGLRLDEQLSLTWPQVSRSRQQIMLEDTKSDDPRIIPLLPRAVTILGTVTRHIRPHGEPDWVFCKRDGSRYGKLTRGLTAAAKRAGIKHLRWHDLRRTCGCRLLQDRKASMEEVSKWLGHESITQTERAYAFLENEQLHERVGTNPGTEHADSKKADQ